MLKDCSNCQIGPYGGLKDRPDIRCAINVIAQKLGVWDLAHGKRFYCSAYHEYGTNIDNPNWNEEDEKQRQEVLEMYQNLKRLNNECTETDV